MSRLRWVLLSMFAVFAVSAVGAMSASAAPGECGINTGKFTFCDHTGKEITHQLLLGLSLLSILEAKVGGAALKVECPDDHLDITILLLGKTRGSILFLGCSVTKPAECKVEKTLRIEFSDLLVGVEPSPLDEFTGSGTGEEFTKLKITGCSVEGVYTVTGKQLVEFPSGEESLAAHLIVAKKSGSKIKIGTESASYSGITHDVLLESRLPWLVMLGT